MVNLLVFSLSLLSILLIFVLYPLSVLVISLFIKKTNRRTSREKITLSHIVVVRNGEKIIIDKIKNCISMHYPPERYEIIFFSDGSTDETERIIRSYKTDRFKLLSSVSHCGKHNGLNEAVSISSGEIIVFSDADALLSPEALKKIVRHYADPKIGGVCGQRIIREEEAEMKVAQEEYIRFDSFIKILESKIGSITSNDGKLYSIRKKLFRPIDPAVTDDLYCCLSIIKQKHRFIFEPEAKAFISIPSRNTSHEILRRRRIVSRSLRGIFSMKELLNPFRYGFYSIGLAINKLLRRMLPVFLLILFVSSLILSFYIPYITSISHVIDSEVVFCIICKVNGRLIKTKLSR